MKKTLHLWATVLIILGIIISFSASAMIQIPEEKTLVVKRGSHSIALAGMDFARAKTKELVFSSIDPLASELVVVGSHPAIASDDLGNVVLGFEDENPNVGFTSSLDFGETWSDYYVSWQIPEPPELPDVDSCGDGRFIGGMVPNYLQSSGSELYKVEVSDPGVFPDGYSCPYWILYDVSEGYTNIRSVAVAGYTAEDPEENTWAFGSHAIVCDEVGGSTDIPLYFYQFNAAGYAWFISFDETLVGCEVAANDIDLVTLESYGVWNFNNSGSMDLFFYKLDFGTWVPSGDNMIHPEIGSGIITTAGNDDYVDVSAHNDNVIIVSQRDGDIVAYYSYNGLSTVEETIIETGAAYPRILHTDEDTVSCIFIKDNFVFYTLSDDGGATWITPEPMWDSAGVPEEYKAADVCGCGIAWEGIYFGWNNPPPHIEIEDITGVFGIRVVIKNKGADAINVEWSIKFQDGLILLPQDRCIEGVIPRIESGSEKTVKSRLVFGIGITEINVTASIPYANTATKSVDGFVFGPFVFIKDG